MPTNPTELSLSLVDVVESWLRTGRGWFREDMARAFDAKGIAGLIRDRKDLLRAIARFKQSNSDSGREELFLAYENVASRGIKADGR